MRICPITMGACEGRLEAALVGVRRLGVSVVAAVVGRLHTGATQEHPVSMAVHLLLDVADAIHRCCTMLNRRHAQNMHRTPSTVVLYVYSAGLGLGTDEAVCILPIVISFAAHSANVRRDDDKLGIYDVHRNLLLLAHV